MGGAGTQHAEAGGFHVAYFSFSSSEPSRWMIQIWSFASAATPITAPMTQWFGNGFGHMGSTSNRGAWTVAASTTALFWSTEDPTASAPRSVTQAAPK